MSSSRNTTQRKKIAMAIRKRTEKLDALVKKTGGKKIVLSLNDGSHEVKYFLPVEFIDTLRQAIFHFGECHVEERGNAESGPMGLSGEYVLGEYMLTLDGDTITTVFHEDRQSAANLLPLT